MSHRRPPRMRRPVRPRAFQNLRASRETELSESFPLHVVTSWMGNTQPVVRRHCLQTTDEHFERAAQCAQNPAQYPAAQGRAEQNVTPKEGPEKANLQHITTECEAVQSASVGDVGFEPTTG